MAACRSVLSLAEQGQCPSASCALLQVEEAEEGRKAAVSDAEMRKMLHEVARDKCLALRQEVRSTSLSVLCLPVLAS